MTSDASATASDRLANHAPGDTKTASTMSKLIQHDRTPSNAKTKSSHKKMHNSGGSTTSCSTVRWPRLRRSFVASAAPKIRSKSCAMSTLPTCLCPRQLLPGSTLKARILSAETMSPLLVQLSMILSTTASRELARRTSSYVSP